MIPAYVPHPGVILKKEIDTRGWSLGKFAQMIDQPIRIVNDIINGKMEIGISLTKEFARVFGTSRKFWRNLDRNYHLWKER
jgi:plasmid maintenance system antidote protein VapI